MSNLRVVVLPLDGNMESGKLHKKFREILSEADMRELIAFVKINDAAFMEDLSAPLMVESLFAELEANGMKDAGLFLDLKSGDVKETLKNIAKHFGKRQPDILTVSSKATGESFLELRRALPKTKLALFSVGTDMKLDICRKRHGKHPDTKILEDVRNIEEEYAAVRKEDDPLLPFDLIVCSGNELDFLTAILGFKYGYIVPGIRDRWMAKDHQQRIIGVRTALNKGATYVVMGSQLVKGSSDNNVSAAKSRKMTIEEIKRANIIRIVPGDPLATLSNCGGYYKCPEDADGRLLGPLTPYAGKYEVGDGTQEHYVGKIYFNFARAEQQPKILKHYGQKLAEKIRQTFGDIDVLVGAPEGGKKLATATADALGCRGIFAEKVFIAPTDTASGLRPYAKLVIKRHEIKYGDRVVIVEDVMNNFTTTEEMIKILLLAGASTVDLACFLNRSDAEIWKDHLIANILFIPTDQYRQDDPAIIEHVKAGGIIKDPKGNWDDLLAIMGKYR